MTISEDQYRVVCLALSGHFFLYPIMSSYYEYTTYYIKRGKKQTIECHTLNYALDLINQGVNSITMKIAIGEIFHLDIRRYLLSEKRKILRENICNNQMILENVSIIKLIRKDSDVSELHYDFINMEMEVLKNVIKSL